MYSDQHLLEEIARAGIRLLLREPFYAHVLGGLNKRLVGPESQVQTLALTLRQDRWLLLINRHFWSSLLSRPDWQDGLLKHELLHLLFKHPLVREPDKDRRLVDIAMDLVVNQYIKEEHLPPSAMRLSHLAEWQLEENQGWVYYYRQLEAWKKEFRSHMPAAEQIGKWYDQQEELDRHLPWKPAGDLSSLETNLLDGLTDQLILEALRKTPREDRARLPGNLRLYLDSLLIPPRPLVDWRCVLRLFAASSARTRIRNTIQRTSQRYGTVPGIKVQRLRKLLVALDTSGSISREEIRVFFHEIHHLWRQGAEIRIVECDADIQRSYEYRGQPPAFVSGRGDTNFEAPIRYGNRDYLPDGLIYLTDGLAPAPKIQPRFPILWVISPQGVAPQSEAFAKLPGRKVKLNEIVHP